MPSVLHVTTTDMSLALLLAPQLRAFRAAGYDVVTASAPGPFLASVESEGFPHHPLRHATRGMALHRDLGALAELYRLFRTVRPDIVHTHNPKPGVYGRWAAKAARVPLVVNTQHGLYAQPTDRLARRLPVYALERLAAACSDIELVQNAEDIDTLARLGVPRSKLRLLGNGVDLQRFRPQPPSVRAAVRAELGVSEREVLVGAVGRLVWEKGYKELFEAVASLLARRDDIRVVVAGPYDADKGDPLTPADVEAARAAGVQVLGLRDDTERLYAALDIYVLASHREGFPRSAMEAAASGLPVIATDVRGCRQVVDDETTGVLVPVRDPRALEKAIERLVDQPDLRASMGGAAHAKARREFDQQQVVDRTLDAYSRLRTSRRPAGDAAKRVLDVVIAAFAMLVTAPVLAALALAVRLRLGAPVLFRQTRLGRGEVPFDIVKFRTMTDARGADGALLPDAERLTGFGRFLRSTSLDELPELWNVLKGDMSLVGPRPLPVTYKHRYTPQERRRHEIRPGVTGWAQVNGRNTVGWEHRLALDVWYVEHRSLRLDLQILAATAAAVLRRSGISAEGHATMDELRPHLTEEQQ